MLNIRGELDFSQAEFERLQPDWVIASIHSDTLQPGEYTQEDFNQLWLNIAQNRMWDMIGHWSQSATAMIMTPWHPFLPGIIKWWS